MTGSSACALATTSRALSPNVLRVIRSGPDTDVGNYLPVGNATLAQIHTLTPIESALTYAPTSPVAGGPSAA